MVRRSHPPSLTTLVTRSLLDDCGVERGDSILVAVSGGPDSMALLHALSLISRKLPLGIVAAGVDHGLRSAAASELDLAEALCEKLSVPFERIQLRLPAGGNLQARARDARYAALRETQKARASRWLATAHQADDRAETVLLRLLRGAPPEGLSVLPSKAGDLIRPMLQARRSDVLLHLGRHGVAFSEDPSNHERRFLRARVRHELVPLLEELSPGIVKHLNTLADELSLETLPRVEDEQGSPLRLGQAQRQALRKALRDRSRRARVLLTGARSLGLNPEDQSLQFFEAPVAGFDKCRRGPSKTTKKS